ncbi:MAG: hypothetical protein ABR611_15495, partial [Chthoniobacterales bacterium]
GMLYGLPYDSTLNGAASVRVYDPVSLAFTKEIVIPDSVSNTPIQNVAADAQGRIFLSGQNGTIYRLASDGQLEASQATGYTRLTDMDVDETGRLVVAQNQGRILLGDTSLQNAFSSFVVVDQPVAMCALFVSFAHAAARPPGPSPTPIPTPVPTATPVPTHDILVSVEGTGAGGNFVRQFTPSGAIVRTIPFNYNGGTYPYTETLRDIVVDKDGYIDAYNGTLAPLLTRYSTASNSFTHTRIDGWSNEEYVTIGGIATYGSFIFLSDTNAHPVSDPTGTPNGIIRFDTTTNRSVRAGEGINFTDVSVGLDGKVYGLYSEFGAPIEATDINVYDPDTLALVRTIPIQSDVAYYEDIRGVAADAAGRIFISGLNGGVFRLNSQGVVEASGATGLTQVADLDIDETGRLLLTQVEGRVIVGDVSLESFRSFKATIGNEPATGMFVAFAPLSGPPPELLNLSTRLNAGLTDKVGIGGFIITGAGPKKVLLRAIGPSLAAFGVTGVLDDPTLELHASDGSTIAFNDDWETAQGDEIRATTLAPTNPLEAAIVRTLPPGTYTAVVSGKSADGGVGLVELYDLSGGTDATLANISTRAQVKVGDGAVIGGVIVGGALANSPGVARVLIRGMGPSLTRAHVANALQDPTIEVHDANGETIATNDNWFSATNWFEVSSSGLAPGDQREAAVLLTLSQGNYTAVLRGAGNTTGVGLIEIYHLQ